MYRNNVYTFKNLPVQQKLRKRTDVCCTIISSIFAITLFVLSFIFFHRQNYYETNFPIDDVGSTCAYDQPSQPYIYFANPNDLSSGRYCVSNCPAVGQGLTCSPANELRCSLFGGSPYSTEGVINRLGGFCMPTDPNVADHVWNQPQISVKNSILQAIDILLLSLLFALCIGIIYMALVSCCPSLMVRIVFVLAVITLLFAGIFILAKPVQFFYPKIWNILLGVALIITGLAFFLYLCCHNREITLSGIFMNYGNKFLKSDCKVWLYIPLFLILTAGLIVLIVWQYIAFGTTYPSTFNQCDLYRSSSHCIPLQILNAIELIWGLQFLRDAFNFVVSGNAVQWYFNSQNNNYQSHCCHPFMRFLCYNWGSVAGGSFLNAFFIIFDSISDIFRCDPQGSCGNCFETYRVCCCCDYILQLVRTDAYSYINLTGIPYCNAARQCQALCRYSQGSRGSQSFLRLYRNAAHIFLVALVAIISYFILAAKGGSFTNWFIIALIVFGAYCISTYFIDFHADAAEGVQVSYLTERNCEGQFMEVYPPGLREDIYNFSHEISK